MAKPPSKHTGSKRPTLTVVGKTENDPYKILPAKDKEALLSSIAKLDELFISKNSRNLDMGDQFLLCKSLLPTDAMWLKFAASLKAKHDVSLRTIYNCMGGASLRANFKGIANFANIATSALYLLNGKNVSKKLREDVLNRTNSEFVTFSSVKDAIDAAEAKAEAEATKAAAKAEADKAKPLEAKAAATSSNVVSSKPEQIVAKEEEMTRLATEAAAETAKSETRTASAGATPSETEQPKVDQSTAETDPAEPASEPVKVTKPLGPEHFAGEVVSCISRDKALYVSLIGTNEADIDLCFASVAKFFRQISASVQAGEAAVH